jgi:branched-chain amino acid transport system permease protein
MKADRYLALVGLLVLLACVFAAFRGQYFFSAIVLAGIYTIAVLALVLLTGLTGQFSLGHSAFFGVGAYVAAGLAMRGVPPWFGCILAVVGTALFAAVVAVPIVRLKGHLLALGTLAVGLIALSIFNGWSSVTLGASGIADIPPIRLGEVEIKGESANFVLVWTVALLCLLGALNLWRSPFGRAALAVKRDEGAAAAMGINVSLLKVQVFALSAALAGLAGALYAHYVSFIAPERFALNASFELLLGALLGGVGNPFGAAVGAVFLIVLPDLVAPLRDYKVIVYGVIFILVSLYLPRGLVGVLEGVFRAAKRLSTRDPVAQAKFEEGSK